MARTMMVAGNWKMNKTSVEGVALIQKLKQAARTCGKSIDIVVAPPHTAIRAVSTVINIEKMAIRLAAQDMHPEAEGAFTGEVSARMLLAEGVAYVIVGHSERRECFGETDQVVNEKAKAVFSSGMIPILCCGEPLEVREDDETGAWISNQITEGLADMMAEDVERLVIAYEPIWAIGTGKTATPQMAQDTCEMIRAIVADMYEESVARKVRILYGGSVTEHNAHAFFAEYDIDGALVGGASLSDESFAKIIEAAC